MEQFDLYTKAREKTGITLSRGEAIPQPYVGVIVFVCLFNKEGKMLIQQRDIRKKSWPGLWDVSAGGLVHAQESSMEAAIRETKEEIGVDISFPGEMPSLSVYYDNYIHDIWVAEAEYSEHEFVLQQEEVSAVRWADQEEIFQMIDEGTFVKVYKEFIQLLFRMKTQRGIL